VGSRVVDSTVVADSVAVDSTVVADSVAVDSTVVVAVAAAGTGKPTAHIAAPR
jgi:hypothetical protein